MFLNVHENTADSRLPHPDDFGVGFCLRGQTITRVDSRRREQAVEKLMAERGLSRCQAMRLHRQQRKDDMRPARDKMREVFRHNLRRDHEHHRCRKPIDATRSGLNQILIGPACPDQATAHWEALAGERPFRTNGVLALEHVIQSPPELDIPAFWASVQTVLCARFDHPISFVIHRDQSRVHAHFVAMPIIQGVWVGADGLRLAHHPDRVAEDVLRHLQDSHRVFFDVQVLARHSQLGVPSCVTAPDAFCCPADWHSLLMSADARNSHVSPTRFDAGTDFFRERDLQIVQDPELACEDALSSVHALGYFDSPDAQGDCMK
ncbi:plasmid recombination protein, partial [Sphaerotilus natans]